MEPPVTPKPMLVSSPNLPTDHTDKLFGIVYITLTGTPVPGLYSANPYPILSIWRPSYGGHYPLAQWSPHPSHLIPPPIHGFLKQPLYPSKAVAGCHLTKSPKKKPTPTTSVEQNPSYCSWPSKQDHKHLPLSGNHSLLDQHLPTPAKLLDMWIITGGARLSNQPGYRASWALLWDGVRNHFPDSSYPTDEDLFQLPNLDDLGYCYSINCQLTALVPRSNADASKPCKELSTITHLEMTCTTIPATACEAFHLVPNAFRLHSQLHPQYKNSHPDPKLFSA
ncbi:hypothetical protein DSO57_1014518 [Entomophthora muscae]|uniref:Uncharacterized protein n=1 Tax=Entomophthora muscae TaxID=34485 RepID=A0ACC2T6B5_9FUNG|nr:hypothetical protein DSO57_1014518 [Entomophthora muscae]